MGRPQEKFWYALKVFYGRRAVVEQDFKKARYQTWYPREVRESFEGGELKYTETPLIASLLLVRCPAKFLLEYKRTHDSLMMYYPEPGTSNPGRVDDHEMEIFMLVNSVRDPNVEFRGADDPGYHKGDKVRVTGGIYKGLEGYVKRIDREKRLIVCLTGVCVVAVSHIHPSLLEKIPASE